MTGVVGRAVEIKMADRYLIPSLPVEGYGFVPELKEKKVKAIEQITAEKKKAMAARKAEWQKQQKALIERTLAYEKEYTERESTLKKLHADAEKQGGFYREPDAKVVFCVRLHGINKMAPKPRKILQLMRLRQINNGVFIKLNKSSLELLKVVAPFVTFGTLTRDAIRQLLYRRGCCKIGKRGAWSRKRIQGNDVISDHLGKYGIHGIEDIVHEIYTCGPHFKEVTNFLWPFKLSAPRGGWIAKRRGFTDPRKGDWGDREGHMTALVKRMV